MTTALAKLEPVAGLDALTVFYDDPRPIELGKIKIGGKSAQVRKTAAGKEWRAPEKHDYFTITTLGRNQAGDLEEDASVTDQLIEECGDPPEMNRDRNDKRNHLRRIPIRVLSNEIQDIMQSAYVWYAGRIVGARSNGREVIWYNDPTTGARLDQPKIETWTPELLETRNAQGIKIFKLHTVFNCVIATKQAKWGGVYKFRTTSVVSSRQLFSTLVLLHQRSCGILEGMPLMLVVRRMEVAPEGKPTTVYVVHVEMRVGDEEEIQKKAIALAQLQLERKQEMQAVRVSMLKMLPAPGMESNGEAAHVNEEFSPETADDAVSARPAAKPDEFWDSMLGGKKAAPAPEPARAEVPTALDPVMDAEYEPAEPVPSILTVAATDKRKLIEEIAVHLAGLSLAEPLEAVALVQAVISGEMKAGTIPQRSPAKIETLAELELVRRAIIDGRYDCETGNKLPDEML